MIRNDTVRKQMEAGRDLRVSLLIATNFYLKFSLPAAPGRKMQSILKLRRVSTMLGTRKRYYDTNRVEVHLYHMKRCQGQDEFAHLLIW